MTNHMDEEFDRIARKEIRSQIAMAFISLEYEARLLDEQTRSESVKRRCDNVH